MYRRNLLKHIKVSIICIIIGIITGIAFEIAAHCDECNSFPILLAFSTTIGLLTGAVIDIVRHCIFHKNQRSKKINEELSILPTEIGEFIKLIIKKMKYRQKVCAEVRRELIAHFEDELKDCKDQQEKEEKVKQLIEEFGDIKMLGILLRRAKKRCRSLWRTAVVRTFQGIEILFALFIIYCIYLIQGAPVIRVDYVHKMNELAHPQVDKSQNAAPLYKEAITSFAEEPNIYINNENRQKKLLVAISDKNWPDELTEEELKLLEKWVIDNSKTIELYKQGSLKPHCWWDRTIKKDESLMHLLLPELAPIRNITKIICWQTKIKAHNNDVEGAFSDILSMYQAGEHFKGPRILIEQLIGMAIQSLAVDTVYDIIAKKEISAKTLQNFQKDFTRLYNNGTYIMDFKSERFFFMDFIQRCYTDDGRGSGKMSPRGLKKYAHGWGDDFFTFTEDDWTFGMQYLGASLVTADREAITDMVNYYYNSFDDYAVLTPWQAHNKKLKNEIDLDKWSQIKRIRYWPVTYLLPALKTASQRPYRNKANSQALITVIALKRYKQTNGEYPEKLEQLVEAGFIKEVPMDPFSNKTLVYKKIRDDFILYSISLDFKDDGGISGTDKKGKPRLWADDGDAVFWPILKDHKK